MKAPKCTIFWHLMSAKSLQSKQINYYYNYFTHGEREITESQNKANRHPRSVMAEPRRSTLETFCPMLFGVLL